MGTGAVLKQGDMNYERTDERFDETDRHCRGGRK